METESKPDTPDTAYLERHGRKWRVSVPVPTTLRSVLGTRLKRVLDTESLEAANILKRRVIVEFREEIARAREAEVAGRDDRRRTNEAMALRKERGTAKAAIGVEEFSKAIHQRVDVLRRELEMSRISNAESKTKKYKAVALDGKTPVDYYYEDFTNWLKETNPYTVGYPQTLETLIKALHSHGVEPFIENVDHRVVEIFIQELKRSTRDKRKDANITWRRVSYYWEWLMVSGHARNNPFTSS